MAGCYESVRRSLKPYVQKTSANVVNVKKVKVKNNEMYSLMDVEIENAVRCNGKTRFDICGGDVVANSGINGMIIRKVDYVNPVCRL